MKKLVLVSMFVIALSACATQPYSCPLPEEAGKCMSISEAQQELKSRKGEGRDSSKVAANSIPTYNRPHEKGNGQYKPGNPIWRDARRLRIWFTPHVDRNNNWHDQSYVVVLVDKGEWLVYENRQELLLKNKFMNLSIPQGKGGNEPSSQLRQGAEDQSMPTAFTRDGVDQSAQEFVGQIAQPKGK